MNKGSRGWGEDGKRAFHIPGCWSMFCRGSSCWSSAWLLRMEGRGLQQKALMEAEGGEGASGRIRVPGPVRYIVQTVSSESRRFSSLGQRSTYIICCWLYYYRKYILPLLSSGDSRERYHHLPSLLDIDMQVKWKLRGPTWKSGGDSVSYCCCCC